MIQTGARFWAHTPPPGKTTHMSPRGIFNIMDVIGHGAPNYPSPLRYPSNRYQQTYADYAPGALMPWVGPALPLSKSLIGSGARGLGYEMGS